MIGMLGVLSPCYVLYVVCVCGTPETATCTVSVTARRCARLACASAPASPAPPAALLCCPHACYSVTTTHSLQTRQHTIAVHSRYSRHSTASTDGQQNG